MARSARRVVLAALLTSAVILPTAGCGLFGDDEGDAAQRFLDALAAGDVTAAAAATDDPAAAASVLDLRTALEPVSVQARDLQLDGTRATYTLDWDLGEDRRWTYQASADIAEGPDGPTVRWAPTVLHPQLADGQRVRVDTLTAPAPPVLAGDGAELLAELPVVSVVIDAGTDPATVAGPLADALNPIEPDITAASVTEGIGADPAADYTAVVLRTPDFERVRADVEPLPGVRTLAGTRLLTRDPALASPLLGGLRSTLTDRLTADAGWRVAAVDADGGLVTALTEQAPVTTSALRSTVDVAVQRAAQDALAAEPRQAATVVIRPSDGAVLAAAQTPAADAEGPIALSGLYPPGSTFKMITTMAALQAGVTDPDAVLPCPFTENIRGRQIKNDGFELGAVPLHTAFANSCNTTLARLAVDLPPDALRLAAERVALGVDFVMPGATTVTGAVPDAARPEQRVEWSIGQGEVVASPFGMALATASVARGAAVTPTLLVGEPTTADRTPPALDPVIAEQVRAMMRETVTDGTASALDDIPGLLGKTGTAQFGDGVRSHGWFVAISSDLTVATLVVDGGSSAPAVEVTGRLLRALG